MARVGALPVLAAFLMCAAAAQTWTAASQPAATTQEAFTDAPPRNDAVPTRPFAGLLGSKHDFAAPGAPLIEHCVACHPRPVTGDDAPVSAEYHPDQHQSRDGMARSTLLCMSCHDGLIASDIVGGANGAVSVSSRARVHLQGDHPVGVEYPRFDRGYHPAARAEARGARLPDGRVECVSCHDPHNPRGEPHMLVMSNRRSGLCLTCHIK